MDVELEIVPATWSTLIPGLKAKQYDVIFANLFATPQRALVVNFTEALLDLWIPYRGQRGFRDHDPGGRRLARRHVRRHERHGRESYPKEVFPQAKVRGIVGNDVAIWIGEVASGQADAAFLDPGTFRLLRAKNPMLESGCAC